MAEEASVADSIKTGMQRRRNVLNIIKFSL